jgi:hypothetical protein
MRYPEFLITESDKNQILEKYKLTITEQSFTCPNRGKLVDLGKYGDKSKQYYYCKENDKDVIYKYDSNKYKWAEYFKNEKNIWLVSYDKNNQNTSPDYQVENVKLSPQFSKILDSIISGGLTTQTTSPTPKPKPKSKSKKKPTSSKRGTIEYDN